MSNGYQVTETAVKAQPKMTSCGSHWKAQTVTESGRTLAYIASWSVNCLYQLRLWFCLAHSIIFFQFKIVKSGYIIILLLYFLKIYTTIDCYYYFHLWQFERYGKKQYAKQKEEVSFLLDIGKCATI